MESGKVAALFVESGGCYYGLCNVDPWDIEKDARKYQGPFPIVAHPPCERWGKLSLVNYARYGGDHNRPGNDGGCFESALLSLMKYGGVIEHPRSSMAFAHFNIGKPLFGAWTVSRIEGCWITEVYQSTYGHRANKATWLLYKGETKPFDLDWARTPGTHQVGFADQRGKERNKPTLSKKEARATPERFRDELLKLALLSKN